MLPVNPDTIKVAPKPAHKLQTMFTKHKNTTDIQ